MSKIVKLIVGTVVLAPLLYITSCSIISRVHEHDFAQVKEGDVEARVITTMGQPSDEERAGAEAFLNTEHLVAHHRASNACGISTT